MNILWDKIKTVFLDLDGVILDKRFDDYFWEDIVPQEVAKKENLTLTDARDYCFQLYRSQEGTLNWTDIDFWSKTFNLDLIALKAKWSHRISLRPDAKEFLQFLSTKYHINTYILTDAHPKVVKLKIERVALNNGVLVLSSFDVGVPKLKVEYWHNLSKIIKFNKLESIFIDDRIANLLAADEYQIAHIFWMIPEEESFNTHKEFHAIKMLSELIDADG